MIGPAGLVLYAAEAFPVLDAEGVDLLLNAYDDDHDRFGADGLPGVARVDDNGQAVCVGGRTRPGLPRSGRSFMVRGAGRQRR